jgi:hypothetical protein
MRQLRDMSSQRSEAGETLIEVLMASALMGLVVVAIVGGLATTVLGSHVHRNQAEANAILTGAMEQIKSADWDYSNVKCDINGDGSVNGTDTSLRVPAYETQARTVTLPSAPTGWTGPWWSTASITLVKPEEFPAAAGVVLFQKIDSSSGTPKVTFGDTCDDGLSRQLVTLQVRSPDGRVTQKLSFIKGDL